MKDVALLIGVGMVVPFDVSDGGCKSVCHCAIWSFRYGLSVCSGDVQERRKSDSWSAPSQEINVFQRKRALDREIRADR